MGIYIDMEMPKPGEVIRIYNNCEARRCRVTEQKAFEVGVAIPVPPHGDLIDRDALRDNNCDAFEINGEDGTILTMDVSIIDDAPAIIPASE